MKILGRNAANLLACVVLAFPASAGMVRTLDNKAYEGTIQLQEPGTLLISGSNAGQTKINLDKVRLAQFGLVSDGNSMLKSWQLENIGQAQGNCAEKMGRFALRATAASLPPKGMKNIHQSAHVVHRLFRGDGEFVARIEEVAGPASSPAVAGVMLRENMETTGGFVFLGVTPGLKLQFEAREAGWQPQRRKELGPVTVPLWLKLSRQDRTVTAYRSGDGKTWQKVEQSSLTFASEPFPEGSDAWKPRFYAGMAIVSPPSNAVCSAKFDQVTFTARGLLGMYYADNNFQSLRFSRLDQKISFSWGANGPALELPPDRFSIRWLADVEPKLPGKYSFYYEAEGATRLWLDGKELVLRAGSEKKTKKKLQEVTLNAGQKYPLRVEYRAANGPARLVVGWTKPQGGDEILEKQIFYTYDNASPEEYAEIARTNAVLAKGVWLRNGSFLAGEIRSADDGVTRVAFSGTNELVILNSKIARMVFRRLYRPPAFEKVSRSGVFFKNGDFFESDFKGVKDKGLFVSSVLFGRRRFSLVGGDVTALALNNFIAEPARFEVKLLDGSVLRVNALRPTSTGAIVEDTALGELRVQSRDLVEFRRL